MTDALFQLLGDGVVANEICRGPWDPQHCHGGPVSALLARAVEHAADDGQSWQVARLTIELTRPVPVGRHLTLTTAIERPGRKVSLVAVVLRDGETEVARTRALRVRQAGLDLPADANLGTDAPMASPTSGAAGSPQWAAATEVAFHLQGCEHRFVEGSWDRPGPVGVWIRLLAPVVAGEVPSGLQRLAAAADFGNGVSSSLPYERFVYINPDLTIHVMRPPSGEWIGLRTTSYYGPVGSGYAESALFDDAGRVGRSVQSLYVDSR